MNRVDSITQWISIGAHGWFVGSSRKLVSFTLSVHIPVKASRLLRKNTASVLVGTQTPLLETSCSLDVPGN